MSLTRTLDCPQCGTDMTQREKHDVTIDYCPDCGGVWLDPGELGELTDADHSHSRDLDVDFDEEEEEYEAEAEEEGGLLGTITEALGGGEEEEEFGGEEEWGGGEQGEFGGEEEF